MAPYNEAVKTILADVSKFVNVTLKSEPLSKKAENERTKLVEALEKFYANNYSLAPHSGDEGSTSSHRTPSISGSIEDSKNTTDSHGSEDDYDDNIPPSSLRSLENPTKLGYMDYKRHKEGQILPSSWQKKRYFVLHKRIMYCYKKPSDQKQTFAFLVCGYELNDSPQHTKDAKRKECCFELAMPGKKSHQFLADSKEDLQEWKKHLQQALLAERSSSKENLAEEDDDLYEPLQGGAESISPVAQSEKVSQIQITTEEIPAEEEDDLYTDGTVVDIPPSPTASQPSPSNKSGGGLFSKWFKKKDSEASDKKEKTDDTKSLEKEETSSAIINEFQEEDIYNEVELGLGAGANNSQPPPPPAPETAPPASPAVSTKREQPPPKSPSITSATQAPANAPKLPSRGPVLPPVSPPTSPTPALPPRGPPSSQPPPLPDRDLPPLPERNLPPLPERDLPPLPERNRQPRPPNMPVPPVPSESASSVKASQVVQPQLDKSIIHPREEDYENLYFSAYTCHGVSDSELTFTRGDLIHVISRDLDPQNWWIGELSGKIGLVPKAFLVPAYTEVN
ncbi:Src kinase-associated phosphoprotein 2 [Elysia marginata]|uniref:Src kinase-associated phosphoprotein 2 n=1 Tax=Elysia marginata TaxID=1093978 RepID=A0AAV4EHU4_9GAST|nr:Src kinase-associated phosphoprotein 2 [Elysia marginata]